MNEVVRYCGAGLSELLDALSGSDVRELEVQEGELQVRLHRADVSPERLEHDASVPEQIEPPPPRVVTITSPLVGTFYRASPPDSAPFVEDGARVQEDTVVGIIEALRVLTEVPADCRGIVSHVLVSDAQPVEYGQALFEVGADG